MKRGIIVGLVVLAILILLPFGCSRNYYNSFVDQEENVNKAWANVETVLQRRYDLIPNLVNTVKGYAKHERELLTKVTELRSQWGEARAKGNTEKSVETSAKLEGALGRLLLVSERYPDLKANQNFLALQDQLEGTENRISVERRRYNEAVAAYNRIIRKFPAMFFANLFGFEKRKPFKAAAGAETAPEVQF